mgnify:CR=1 FL=1
MLAVARVQGDAGTLDNHAVVWDAWRRILFIGPGCYDDRGLDGALLVEEADIADPSRVDPTHGMSLAAYVESKFGIVGFVTASVLMVHAGRLADAAHV